MSMMSFAALLAAAAAVPDAVPEAAPPALPPIYQRLAELREIADQPSIASAFGNTPIDRIEYVSTDLYRVTAGRCSLQVRIVEQPMPHGMVGARRFSVAAGKRICRLGGVKFEAQRLNQPRRLAVRGRDRLRMGFGSRVFSWAES